MKKNILINGYSKSVSNLVKRLGRENRLDSTFWICHAVNQEREIKKNHKLSIHLNNYDLCRMNFSSNSEKKVKIPHELLKIILRELPIIVDMMSRFETHKPMSLNDKTTYIYAQLRFWYSYIKVNKIKIYFQIDTPHDVYDYIITIIAKYLKIRLIILQQSSFYKSENKQNKLIRVLTPTSNLLSGEKSLKINKFIGNTLIDFKNVRKAYSLAKKNNAFNARLSLTNTKRENIFAALYNIFRNDLLGNNYVINNIDKISKKVSLLEFKIIRHKIHKRTDELKKILSYKALNLSQVKKKFIYFPLQYQPERTSCPEGRYYSNQFLALMQIRNYLDENIIILVKEHPKQLINQTIRNQMYRSEFFYDNIIGLKNVFFINTNINSKDILRHRLIEGVATVKGNIILEAILNKIPAFFFGNTVWKNLIHSYDCTNHSTLLNISKLIKSKIYFNNAEIEKSFYLCLAGSFLSEVSIHEEYTISEQETFYKFYLKLLK